MARATKTKERTLEQATLLEVTAARTQTKECRRTHPGSNESFLCFRMRGSLSGACGVSVSSPDRAFCKTHTRRRLRRG